MFDHFKNKKKKVKQTDEQQKWNQMWSLWEEGQADSPYAELMTYQSEVSNGGHECDDILYENEEALNCILREYANKIEL